jgi:hypothetical protein
LSGSFQRLLDRPVDHRQLHECILVTPCPKTIRHPQPRTQSALAAGRVVSEFGATDLFRHQDVMVGAADVFAAAFPLLARR